jgi:hypothetical protein
MFTELFLFFSLVTGGNEDLRSCIFSGDYSALVVKLDVMYSVLFRPYVS